MTQIWKLIVNMRALFLSSLVILVIAIGLSHFNADSLNSGPVAFIEKHKLFWVLFRVSMVLFFAISWPMMVNAWSRKYSWPEEYTRAVKNRRWRYIVWFIVIDAAFCLL